MCPKEIGAPVGIKLRTPMSLKLRSNSLTWSAVRGLGEPYSLSAAQNHETYCSVADRTPLSVLIREADLLSRAGLVRLGPEAVAVAAVFRGEIDDVAGQLILVGHEHGNVSLHSPRLSDNPAGLGPPAALASLINS